ncbi:DUF1542 domain-containing protein, partial [Enterococcus faecium]
QAKAAIEAEAKKVKSEIDADGTLTAEEKSKQKAGVDQEAEKAKKAIDGAKDITGVNQAKEAGVKAIDGQHQSVARRKQLPKTGEENNLEFLAWGLFVLLGSFFGLLKSRK